MSRKWIIAAALVLGMSGCATRPVPINYAPSSTLSATGTVKVNDFSYLPAQKGTVKANQARNTAMGDIYFDKDVAKIMRDAVFSELRLVGVNVNGTGTTLSGEIEEFLIDDLGYSVDWTLRVRYTVKDADGRVVYEQVKNTQRNTNKFVNVFGAMNETIKLNVEDLIKDQAFDAVIK